MASFTLSIHGSRGVLKKCTVVAAMLPRHPILPRGANPDATELICTLGQIPPLYRLQFPRRVIGSGFMSEQTFVQWVCNNGVPRQSAVGAHTSYVYDKTFISFAVCEGL